MPTTGRPAGPPVRRPTSKDVAQAAGVSQSTVSIVLAGKWAGRVSPDTAESVRETAARLGYRLNRAASNLRLGQARTVLLVVPTLSSPFFGDVYAGAARVAADRGFSVVVYLWPDGAGVADSPFAKVNEAIDGVLASSMAVDALAELSADAMPLIMLDSDPGDAVPTVNLDVAAGFRVAVAHLAGLGHRRFGHLAAAVDTWTFRTRRAAVTTAVGSLPGAVLLREHTAIDIRAAREAAGALLRRPDRPTALVCDDDLIAAGAYKAARDLGLGVPADLSVTGFDDILLAEALEPELTTVRLPAQELGAQGMRALLNLLDGGDPASVSLPGTFIARDSTGPAPS
ncbi:LacI family DNA-binding transcriptional regulator [Actinomadura scrupuli]|uniref:LacI family DNA-binding transcriptional regulator n=1 Tax=Actinomadura scrupuli TaxID=559629 RepID=UPI003D989429